MTVPHIPRRALFLTYHDPLCTNYGAGQRTHFLLKALGQFVTTDVVLFSETDTPGSATDLPDDLGGGKLYRINHVPKSFLDSTWSALTSSRLTSLLAATVDFNQYAFIVCRYIAPYLKCRLPSDKPLIIDFDDPIYTVPWSLLRTPRSIMKETVKWLNQGIIKWRLHSPDLRNATFLFVCERDIKAFPQLHGALMSNIPASPKQPAAYTEADANTLLFVGFMGWQPNIFAVDHFLANIWPLILKQMPDAKFRIVGKGSPENLRRWNAAPQCSAEGYVDDIDAAYRKAAICVVPVLSGGGSNIKVPEALAHQRPVVTSRYSFMGWNSYFRAGQDLLVGETDEDFANHCVRLLENANDAMAIALNGHRNVVAVLSFEAFAGRLARICDKIQGVLPAKYDENIDLQHF